jgi:cholest-4-en-3-one 26-monooxygenase
VASTLSTDLTDPSLYRRGFPHELFTDLRRQGKVLRHPKVTVPPFDQEIEFWAVVTHAEIQQANRDWETFSAGDGHSIVPASAGRRATTLLSMDPPEHTQMRRVINGGFTPKVIRQLEERIRVRTEKILDAAADRGDVDFVRDIAGPLPMHVIADIVGIPDDDRPEVFRLIERFVWGGLDPEQGLSMEERRQTERELFGYAMQLSAARRAEPGEDVWSILALGELGEVELGSFFIVLCGAGAETTRNALTQGIMALLAHPEQVDALRTEAALLASATEEVLRWSSPVSCFGRTVTRDVELGGQQLLAGERIGIFYPSGNRDDGVFADPFAFDIRRSPNPHLSFGGGGPHFCLGASLARTEMQVMLGELVRRFPSMEILGEPSWLGVGPANTVGATVNALPVRLGADTKPR